MYKNKLFSECYKRYTEIESRDNKEIFRAACMKINEERKNSPEKMTDEECYQYVVAMQAAKNLARKRIPQEERINMESEEINHILNHDTKVCTLIQSSLSRNPNIEQLSCLIASSNTNPNENPYLIYYKEHLMENAEQSEKIIQAANEINFLGAHRDFDKYLLTMQLSQVRKYMLDKQEGKNEVYEKGLICAFNCCTHKLDTGDYGSGLGKEVLKVVETCNDSSKGDVAIMMRESPNVAKAYKKLQQSCFNSFKRELEEISPLSEQINVKWQERDR